jgi:hypothetical protein
MTKNAGFAIWERRFGVFASSAGLFRVRMAFKNFPPAASPAKRATNRCRAHPPTIPCGMEMAKKFGLEFLPPPGA